MKITFLLCLSLVNSLKFDDTKYVVSPIDIPDSEDITPIVFSDSEYVKYVNNMNNYTIEDNTIFMFSNLTGSFLIKSTNSELYIEEEAEFNEDPKFNKQLKPRAHQNCYNRNYGLRLSCCECGKFLGYSSAHNCGGKGYSCAYAVTKDAAGAINAQCSCTTKAAAQQNGAEGGGCGSSKCK